MKALIKEYLTGCLTIPNLISLIRIALIPVFAVLFYDDQHLWAVIVLAVSGLTDMIDGKIARKFNQISALGKLLDPVADKLTQITIAIVFYLEFRSCDDALVEKFSWIFLGFLIKEAIMIVVAVFMIILGLKPVAAEMPGKVATLAFYCIMCVVMAFGPGIGIIGDFLPSSVMLALVAISLVLAVIALFSYFPGVIQQFKERKTQKSAKKGK